MEYKKILTIQDISCVGQCSLTVALPILSACGFETCVLPTSMLSTHTGGFKGFTFLNLADQTEAILDHWQREGIQFDAVYTGYIGSSEQIRLLEQAMGTVMRPGAPVIVDPAMADHGKLYTGFDGAYVAAMKKLCSKADIILPNLTEACLLTGTVYDEHPDQKDLDRMLSVLHENGTKTVILKGAGNEKESIGIRISDENGVREYRHRRLTRSFHGTGDVFASAFTGALLRKKTTDQAVRIAADFTLCCIQNTLLYPEHWYGVSFEPMLPELIRMLEA